MNEKLNIALMLLEMVLTKSDSEPDLAADHEMLWAAHSYVQAATGIAPVSDDALALYASIRTAVAIEDAQRP